MYQLPDSIPNLSDQIQFEKSLDWSKKFTQSIDINQNILEDDKQNAEEQHEEMTNSKSLLDTLVYSEYQQTQQSGIKIPENLRNQIKQWQEQRQRQITSQEVEQQSEKEEEAFNQESSDQIEEHFYDQMTFQQLYDIITRLPMIKQIKILELVIDEDYNIDQKRKVFRCKYQNKEKVVKVMKELPCSQILQILNNLTHISKLKMPNLCQFDGFYIEEIQNEITLGNLYLVMPQLNCDLQRALQIHELQSKQSRISIIIQLANFLKEYNAHLIHGNLKPSNILLDNKLHIYIVDYGLSDVKNENNDQLFSSQPNCNYAAPEKVFQNQIESTTDVWSFGIILSELLQGALITNGTIQKYGLRDLKKQGYLHLERLDFFPTRDQNQKAINLIKYMTQFHSKQRINSYQVFDQLESIINLQQTPSTPLLNPSINHNQSSYPQQQQQNLSIQKSPSIQCVKKGQTAYAGLNKNKPQPPPSARQGQRYETSTNGFFIQGRQFNLQPPPMMKQKQQK